jgi:hypothetical protein
MRPSETGRKLILAAALLLPLGIGCATVQTKADYDHGVDFSRYHTFNIQEGKLVREGVGDTGNTIVRDRIAAAIRDELTARGLHQSTENPDLEVRFVGGARTKQQLDTALTPMYGPYYAGPVGTDVWVREYQQGTLVIDLVDSGNNKLVWRSVATAEDQDFGKNEFIRKAVARSLAQFPPGKKG